MAPHITALPQPLLELIVSSTNSTDKKSLRRVCRYFQQLLDNSLACIAMNLDQNETRRCFKGLMKRLQDVRDLRTVVLKGHYGLVCLCKLPVNITVLKISFGINFEDLKCMPRLKSLWCTAAYGKITDMDPIPGLTHLQCNSLPYSVAQLAPTLKQLIFYYGRDLQGLNQLTNLEVLGMTGRVPDNFFEAHHQLPLKHLSICPCFCRNIINDSRAWQAAPTTLTRLTFTSSLNIESIVLPTTITHLQLYNMHPGKNTIGKAAVALPGLMYLDCHTAITPGDWNDDFSQLSKLTSLQTFGLCIERHGGACWRRDQVLSSIPVLAKAIETGIQLQVITRKVDWPGLMEEDGSTFDDKSAWAKCA